MFQFSSTNGLPQLCQTQNVLGFQMQNWMISTKLDLRLFLNLNLYCKSWQGMVYVGLECGMLVDLKQTKTFLKCMYYL